MVDVAHSYDVNRSAPGHSSKEPGQHHGIWEVGRAGEVSDDIPSSGGGDRD